MNIVFAGVRRSAAALLIAFAFAAPSLTAQREPIQKPVVETAIKHPVVTGSPAGTPKTPNPGASAATVTSVGSSCTLVYERADNMWAARGRPDGGLGKETITLSQGNEKAFVTDWKYEKQRGDDENRYGSHLRRATNTGQRPISLIYHESPVSGDEAVKLQPGQVIPDFKDDLVAVLCL